VPARHVALSLVGAGALCYIGVAMSTARRSGTTSTYSGHSLALAWWFGVAGLALFAAGVVTAAVGRRLAIGVLAIVAGMLWFGPVWEGWRGGPELIRTLGMVATGFVLPVLIQLVVSAASWPLARPATLLVWSSYVLLGFGALVVTFVRDPYYDPYCWSNCTANTFVVSSQPDLARRLVELLSWTTIAVAVVFAALCVAWLVQGLRARAHRHWEVLPGGIALAGATIAHEVLLRRSPPEDPADASFTAVFVVRCGAAMMIAGGLVATLLAARLQRRSVARIVATLGQAPPIGGLDGALASSLGDPSLRIYYWLPTAGHFADAQGRPLPDPTYQRGLTTTPLVRGGQIVAVVAHRSDPASLEHGLGPAARLALDNERLQAEVRARIHELADSRARIIDAADARRRALERDLHDGAQQTLLSMSYDLQRARSAAAIRGNAELEALVEGAVNEVRTAFGELRDLAHGIYPVVLDAAGLGPAITALADSATIDVDIACAVDDRLEPVVETAAYLVAATAIEAATTGSASHITIAVARRDGAIIVDITHDGAAATADLTHLDDRVGAAGGSLVVTPNHITAELPCESLSPTT
jgi:signal transduction histidine kinase